MKKIPCSYFGEGEAVYFSVGRLLQVEHELGIGVMALGTTELSKLMTLENTLKLLQIGLRHVKRNGAPRPLAFYQQKAQELFNEGECSIVDLTALVMKALLGSGILGKAAYAAAFPEDLTEDEKELIEIETEIALKNG